MRRCPARTIAEEQDYLATAGLFRALSNRRSLRIALELRHAEMGISCMASTMRMRPERLFREMLEMVQQRLVRARRRNKRILYSLEFAEIVRVLDLMRVAQEPPFLLHLAPHTQPQDACRSESEGRQRALRKSDVML